MTQSGKPRIPAGDTFDLIFDIVNDAGQPVILFGVDAVWLLAAKMESANHIFSKSEAAGITLSLSVPGRLTVRISPEDTAALPAKDYWQQLTLTFPDGRVNTVHRGWLTLLEVVP